MYRLTVVIENRETGDNTQVQRLFDPATLTQAKWAAAWPAAIKPAIDALVASSTPNELPTL